MFGMILYANTITALPQINYADKSVSNAFVNNSFFKKMNDNSSVEYNKYDDLAKAEGDLDIMKTGQYYKSYDSIVVDGKNKKLLKPVSFLINETNNGVFFTNTELNIYAAGENFEEAQQDMYEEFKIQWEIYANEDDANLSNDAIKTKSNLRRTIDL